MCSREHYHVNCSEKIFIPHILILVNITFISTIRKQDAYTNLKCHLCQIWHKNDVGHFTQQTKSILECGNLENIVASSARTFGTQKNLRLSLPKSKSLHFKQYMAQFPFLLDDNMKVTTDRAEHGIKTMVQCDEYQTQRLNLSEVRGNLARIWLVLRPSSSTGPPIPP
jgi:hypothetical protein